VEPSARLWQTYTDDVARMGTQLATLDPGDHATWAGVARETAGVFAAWSLRTECVPGPLADASDQLARSAAVHARTVTQRPGRPVSLRGPAFLLMQPAANPSSRTGQALLIRQLGNTLRATRHRPPPLRPGRASSSSSWSGNAWSRSPRHFPTSHPGDP